MKRYSHAESTRDWLCDEAGKLDDDDDDNDAAAGGGGGGSGDTK